MKMELIQADFNIVTPMFLGEADGQCASQIRPPAIKGALRFWWRAINWARIRQGFDNDAAALAELHREEASLFGSSAKIGSDGKTQTGGQGVFLLRVSEQKVRKIEKSKNCLTLAPLQYLASMGLYHFREGLLRDYLDRQGTFRVELAMKPAISETQTKQLVETLECFGLLGCLGSRARKGFGSVAIKKLTLGDTEQPLPKDEEAYKTQLKELLGNCFELQTEPPLTAFSDLSRIQIGGRDGSAMELLARHGKTMGQYRGYGRKNPKTGKHEVFGEKAEQKFWPDHDWAIDYVDKKPVQSLPKRVAFGLPHPYMIGSRNGAKISIDALLDGKDSRRASPLFAHVHQLPSGDCLLIHTILQSLFLPHSASVKVSGGKTHTINGKDASQTLEWSVLTRFLDRFNPTDKDIIHGR